MKGFTFPEKNIGRTLQCYFRHTLSSDFHKGMVVSNTLVRTAIMHGEDFWGPDLGANDLKKIERLEVMIHLQMVQHQSPIILNEFTTSPLVVDVLFQATLHTLLV